jgi:hypothetical protein
VSIPCKTILRLLIILSFLQITQVSLSWAGPGLCIHALSGEQALLERVAKNLEEESRNPVAVVKEMALSLDSYKPLRILGLGVSGVVLEVERGGRHFALKLFFASEMYRKPPDQFSEAILIQKALGQLGLAPKVYGYVQASEVAAWLPQYNFPNKDIVRPLRDGFLMELVDSKTLKIDGAPQGLTPESKRSLLQQADQIDQVLEALGVIAHDVDAIVTKDTSLLLIDLSFYEKHKAIHEQRAIRQFLERHFQWHKDFFK